MRTTILTRPGAALSGLACAAGLLIATPSVARAADPPSYGESRYTSDDGSDLLTVTGRGHGSGRGLSQLGAHEMANKGSTAAQILDFYYPGTTAGQGSDQDLVRVRLDHLPATSLSVAATDGLQVRDLASNAVTPLGAGSSAYQIVRSGAAQSVLGLDGSGGWQQVLSATGPLVFEGTAAAPLRLILTSRRDTSVTVHGTLTALPAPSGDLITVNTLSLHDYLYDAVSEQRRLVDLDAAQEAQAIGLRSYLESLLAAPGAQWDVVNAGMESELWGSDLSCHTQQSRPLDGPAPCIEYAGIASYTDGVLNRQFEQPSARAAVDRTAGQLRTFRGTPIVGEYTTSNGGWTVADPARAYLVAKQDPFNGAEQPWSATLKPGLILSRCQPTDNARITGLVVLGRDGHGVGGGRITSIRIEGELDRGVGQSRVVVSGDSLLECLRRNFVDSAYFTINATPEAAGAPSVVFNAGGWAYLVHNDPFANGVQLDSTQAAHPFGFVLGGSTREIPAALRLRNGALRAFVTGTNGALYSQEVRDPETRSWHNWGGSIVGRPAPVLMPDGSVGVYAQAANGRIYQAAWTPSGAFRGWFNLGGPALAPGAGPGAASTGGGGVMLAVNGGATGVWTRGYVPGRGWGGWSAIGGAVFGSVSAISPSAGVFEVYGTNAAADVLGRDVRVRRYAAGRWGAWQSLGGQSWDSPGVAVSGGTTMVVVMGQGVPGHFQRTRTASGWGPWRRLPF